MGELRLDEEGVSLIALAILFQLMVLLYPPLTSFVPAIAVAVLAGLRFNALSGFATGFAGLAVAAFLTGATTSVLLVQSLLAGVAGIIGGASAEAKSPSRSDFLTLVVVSAIAYEIGSNLLFAYYGLPNPLNPFYYFDAPALSSAVNIFANLALAVVLSYSVAKK